MSHDKALIEALRKDREGGASIHELMRDYNLPKSTIWHNVQSVKLSEDDRKRIRSRQGGSKARSQLQWLLAQEKADNMLKEVSWDSIWPILIASLYWSEGTKKSGFVFTNTDPDMINVFLKILRARFMVKEDDLDILIRTSIPMDPQICRRYWSGVLKVPLRAIRTNHSATHNKSKTMYGMCRITLRKGGPHLKVMHCLIKGIADKMLERSRSLMDRTGVS